MPKTCPDCKGSGKKNFFSKCKTCGGVGSLPDPVTNGGNTGVMIFVVLLVIGVLAVCVSGGNSGRPSTGGGIQRPNVGISGGGGSGSGGEFADRNCIQLQSQRRIYLSIAEGSNINNPSNGVSGSLLRRQVIEARQKVDEIDIEMAYKC